MVRIWRDAKGIPHIHLNDLTVVSSMTDYACFLYKKQTFSLQPRRFLSNPAFNVSQVFLKILEISNSNKETKRRRVGTFSYKYLRDGCCLYFVSSSIEALLAKADFSKFAIETQPTCVS